MKKISLLSAFGFVVVWVFIFIPTIVFLLLATSSSTDVVSKNLVLANAIGSVKAELTLLFPNTDFFRHARSTSFPEVATLTTAFAALWVPLMTLAILVTSITGFKTMRRAHLEVGSNLKGQLLSIFVGPFLAVGSIYFFFAVPGDPSSAGGLTTTSRFGYSFMAIATVWVATGLIGSLPVNVVNLLRDLKLTKGE